MAAEEKFIALYSGFDERTGARKPPAVPLQELLAAAARTGTGQASSDSNQGAAGGYGVPFWRGHPLQAFDERNFTSESFIHGGTYDRHARAGAEALRQARRVVTAREPLIPQPLPERIDTTVGVEDLVAFYENPAREFLRRRLEVTVPRAADEPENDIPITLEGLDKWKIGDRLLGMALNGIPLTDAVEAERRRGQLPPGRLGEPALHEISKNVQNILDSAGPKKHLTADIQLDLSSGVRVRGVVGGIVPGDEAEGAGRRVESLTYSSIGPKHVVGAWVRLLALAAHQPDVEWVSVLRGKRGSVTLHAPGAGQAVTLLGELAEFREKGMRFPLGVPPKTASAFTHQYEMRLRRYPDDVPGAVSAGLQAAERVWASGLYPERGDDAWWARIYGPRSHAADLNAWNSLAYWGPRIWSPIHAAGGRVS